MNVEIGAEAAQFPEKEYINGIAGAVYGNLMSENSQDYAQKPQRYCTFMNSASDLKVRYTYPEAKFLVILGTCILT
jgi:hypothetical protein